MVGMTLRLRVVQAAVVLMPASSSLLLSAPTLCCSFVVPPWFVPTAPPCHTPGHIPQDQRKTFEGLWAALRPGGVYIVRGGARSNLHCATSCQLLLLGALVLFLPGYAGSSPGFLVCVCAGRWEWPCQLGQSLPLLSWVMGFAHSASPVHRSPPMRAPPYWAACPPLQVEDLLTSYWEEYSNVKDKEGVIELIKTAIDEMNCHGVMPDRNSATFKKFCSEPRLGKSFLSLDCSPEICAMVKAREEEDIAAGTTVMSKRGG